ncbi:MAG TPA: hypothetical protein VJ765_10375 [Chitinophagaceae bacterium]|nr:hypothetical protein [Chitinophagaceae bacterium]
MKKLLTKSTFALLLSTGFIGCQKETVTVTESNEATTSVKPGPGPMEFTQRSANGSVVIYSAWITKTQADWTGLGTHEIQTSINAPSLSDAIKNNGVVLVYYKSGEQVRPLPITWFDDIYKMTTDYAFEKQKITLFIRLFGNVIGGVLDYEFRYVLIPGTQANGRMAFQVDYKDYDAVCKYYNIPK